MHTTNYRNTFIEIASDCPVKAGESPPHSPMKQSLASLQYEILSANPYKYTSDEIVFMVYAIRNKVADSEWDSAREAFFSKGQPCLRSSPLAKRYGWGIHSNNGCKVALYGSESKEYQTFKNDPTIKKVRAMNSARKA